MNTSFIAQVDIQLLEVNATEQPPDGWHDDIVDQRAGNLAESCADVVPTAMSPTLPRARQMP